MDVCEPALAASPEGETCASGELGLFSVDRVVVDCGLPPHPTARPRRSNSPSAARLLEKESLISLEWQQTPYHRHAGADFISAAYARPVTSVRLLAVRSIGVARRGSMEMRPANRAYEFDPGTRVSQVSPKDLFMMHVSGDGALSAIHAGSNRAIALWRSQT